MPLLSTLLLAVHARHRRRAEKVEVLRTFARILYRLVETKRRKRVGIEG